MSDICTSVITHLSINFSHFHLFLLNWTKTWYKASLHGWCLIYYIICNILSFLLMVVVGGGGAMFLIFCMVTYIFVSSFSHRFARQFVRPSIRRLYNYLFLFSSFLQNHLALVQTTLGRRDFMGFFSNEETCSFPRVDNPDSNRRWLMVGVVGNTS